jgi:hypothetical protein
MGDDFVRAEACARGERHERGQRLILRPRYQPAQINRRTALTRKGCPWYVLVNVGINALTHQTKHWIETFAVIIAVR